MIDPLNEPSQIGFWEQLSRIDRLIARARDWATQQTSWEPARQSQALMNRVLGRVDSLRIRLESPLVVATFGGTGVGKSTLVNALVGQEVTRSGRQRPTTMNPTLLIHPRFEADELGLPVEQLQVVPTQAALLEQMLIIDCPDPDTSDDDASGTNLDRLKQILPFCDVLIYVSTQQKYRSAKVQDELREAAQGCRLVFVQSHADQDVDIREDWKTQLSSQYDVPELFFVDSLKALQEQKEGKLATEDFGRLQQFLLDQLSQSSRVSVRRANVLDLLGATLSRVDQQVTPSLSECQQLTQQIEEKEAVLRQKIATRFEQELLSCKGLWEQRLVSAVCEHWGTSPFALALRTYHGLGTLISSFTLMRARSSLQMLVIGTLQGARWLSSRQEQINTQDRLDRIDELVADPQALHQADLALEGYAREAGFSREEITRRRQQSESVQFEDRFFSQALQQIDHIIDEIAFRNSGWLIRGIYELLLLIYPGFVLYRIGRNFFLDSFLYEQPILGSEFYIPAALFLVLIVGTLTMLFVRRLSRGLKRRIHDLAVEVKSGALGLKLFPVYSSLAEEARQQSEELSQLNADCRVFRKEFAHVSSLGVKKTETAEV